jgi:hypothetical protein
MSYQYEPLSEEYKFQTFLKDLFNAQYNCLNFEEYGLRGHIQHGIDIYSPNLRIAVQAKKKDIHRSQNSIIKELLNDLSETLKQIKNFPHPIDQLYFATTTKKHIAIQNACIAASQAYGVSVVFLSWDDIQLILSDHLTVRSQYFPHLKEAATSSETALNEQIARLELLISKFEGQNRNTPKQYREIPYSDILLPKMDQEAQKVLTAYIMKVALFQTFAQIKYKKFRCLFNFGISYTQFEDGTSAPGFEIIGGEVQFLANCTRLIKTLQNEPDRFWDQIDQHKADKEFNHVKFRMELLPIEGLTCYDFEIDGQTGHYYVKVKSYEGIEYHNLDSLSSVLPFIAASTRPIVNVIDLDRIAKHSAFMKLLHHLLKENSFKRSLLKVNVDNFEDWDFEYYPSEEDQGFFGHDLA